MQLGQNSSLPYTHMPVYVGLLDVRTTFWPWLSFFMIRFVKVLGMTRPVELAACREDECGMTHNPIL